MEQKVIEHWINGSHQPSLSNRYGDIYNPATGKVIAKLPMGNSDDLEKAVNAAELASKSW